MADKLMQPTWDPLVLAAQLQKIAKQSQTLMQRFVSNQPTAIKLGIGDTSSLGFDFFELMTRMMTDPAAVASAQIDLFNDTLSVWQKAAGRMLMRRAHEADAPKDKRFKHPEWSENAIFDFVKDSYLVAAKSILSAIRGVKGMDEASARRVDFYTRQFVDALSPSNFVTTNPEVLTATLQSGGQNLLRGLENLLADLERGNGRLAITMTDLKAFRLGENIATTPGKIVYQNELMQLIQYTQSTRGVRRRPLLIVPPWINKFYVLDLQPKNSFIKWAVDQGHTVFAISWVNPDEKLAEKGFENYMLEGPLAALAAIEFSDRRAQRQRDWLLPRRDSTRLNGGIFGRERRRPDRKCHLFRDACRFYRRRGYGRLHRRRAAGVSRKTNARARLFGSAGYGGGVQYVARQ